MCSHWDLPDVSNLCYANEKKNNEGSCLDQKLELSGRSPKGVVQLETEKLVSSDLEQDMHQTSPREAANNAEPRGPTMRGQKVAKREFKT